MNADSHDIPGLREVGEAYARATSDEHPPTEIDRAVRAAAIEQASSVAASRSRAPRWAVSAALAATITLVVASWLGMNRETTQPVEPSTAGVDAPNAARSGGWVAPGGARASGKITFDSGDAAAATPRTGAANAGDCAAVNADPAAWLACIATVERAGRTADAARELAAFRARFPDHVLPPELDPSRAR